MVLILSHHQKKKTSRQEERTSEVGTAEDSYIREKIEAFSVSTTGGGFLDFVSVFANFAPDLGEGAAEASSNEADEPVEVGGLVGGRAGGAEAAAGGVRERVERLAAVAVVGSVGRRDREGEDDEQGGVADGVVRNGLGGVGVEVEADVVNADGAEGDGGSAALELDGVAQVVRRVRGGVEAEEDVAAEAVARREREIRGEAGVAQVREAVVAQRIRDGEGRGPQQRSAGIAVRGVRDGPHDLGELVAPAEGVLVTFNARAKSRAHHS